MPVKWRLYERNFTIGVVLLMGIKVFSKLLKTTHADVSTIKIILHYTTEWLLAYGVPLGLLLVINYWLLKRYAHTRHQVLVFLGAAVLVWIILSTANVLLVDLQIQFRLMLDKDTSGSARKMGIGRRRDGLIEATQVVVIYSLYLLMRETIMQFIKKQNNHISTMICNQIVGAAFLYSFGWVVLRIASYFDLLGDIMAVIYLYIVLPVIIITFINVYILYPWQHRRQLPVFRFGCWLAIAPAVLSLVCCVVHLFLSSDFYLQLIPVHWFLLMVIGTPLSWGLFQLQKEKLTTLQLKKDLGKSTADLAFLRSQINPHFLFNTLNTLYGSALQEQATKTATGVQKLGDMMRFLLHENNRDQIPLSKELEYLKNYIALQRLRIAESKDIIIEIKIEECAADLPIAPMLLIPFVENAFKHGIRLTALSFVSVRFYCHEKGIHLNVANSLHSKRNDEGIDDQSGVGLQNVQQRLQLLYPNAHILQINQQDNIFEIDLHIIVPTS